MCMHAKLLLLCPTLCNAMEWYPPGSSVHGILQVRILEWVAISFSRDLPDLGIKPTSLMSPALADRFFTSSAILGSPNLNQWEENIWRHQGLGGQIYFWKYQIVYFHRDKGGCMWELEFDPETLVSSSRHTILRLSQIGPVYSLSLSSNHPWRHHSLVVHRFTILS